MVKRVLIVDDAAFLRLMLKDILTQKGFIIAGEASNGNEALTKYKECRPDAVTMDITMPECDGVEAIRMIKEFDSAARIVVVSALGHHEMVKRAVKAGAVDFIVKPFQAEKVIESLNKLR